MPHPDAPSMEDAVTRMVAFFEHITPANLAAIDRIYAPDARFRAMLIKVHRCRFSNVIRR